MNDRYGRGRGHRRGRNFRGRGREGYDAPQGDNDQDIGGHIQDAPPQVHATSFTHQLTKVSVMYIFSSMTTLEYGITSFSNGVYDSFDRVMIQNLKGFRSELIYDFMTVLSKRLMEPDVATILTVLQCKTLFGIVSSSFKPVVICFLFVNALSTRDLHDTNFHLPGHLFDKILWSAKDAILSQMLHNPRQRIDATCWSPHSIEDIKVNIDGAVP